MKLSAAIEKAIKSGMYNQCNEFMCVVLDQMGEQLHVPAVTALVSSIHPNSGDIPLACALHARKYMNINDGSWSHEQQFAYTQQLYIWWVFDLKRKGL